MPREINIQVAQKTVSDEWNIYKILEIIQRELEVHEISTNMAVADKRICSPDATPTKSQYGTTRAFIAANESSRELRVKCYFCKGNHYVFKCNEVQDVAETERI